MSVAELMQESAERAQLFRSFDEIVSGLFRSDESSYRVNDNESDVLGRQQDRHSSRKTLP